MSKELIDRWLDDDVDEETKGHLEEWLRDGPENLQTYFNTVLIQEDLRGHYSKKLDAITLPSPLQKTRLIFAVSAVAAVIAACLFIIPRLSGPQATDDPLVWVISGNPEVEVVKTRPGPNPGPIPREQWPVETRVTVSNEPGSLRWRKGCLLEADAGTALILRSATLLDAPFEPRSIHLKGGGLTVRLESSPEPVDIFAGDSRIRASRPTVFTLKDPGPQPFGGGVTLSVIRGDVLLLLDDGKKRSVTAGEDVSLP